MRVFGKLFGAVGWLLLFSAVGWAAEDDKDAVHTFSGKVVTQTGEPASNVIVRHPGSFQDAPKSVTTNADGSYSIAVKANWTSTIFAESADGKTLGFATHRAKANEHNKTVSQELNDIVLKPAKRIVVSTIDKDGQPVKDASVILQADYAVAARKRTNADGRAIITYADGMTAQVIGAVKANVGCDYRVFEDREFEAKPESPGPLPKGFGGKLPLKLNGVKRAEVKVVGPDEKPLVGVRLDPWLIKKPGHGDDWNLPGLKEFRRVTNDEGVAVFDMLPVDQERGIQIWPRLENDDWFAVGNGEHADERASIQWEEGDSATIQCVEKVAVGGRVFHADGKPAANISIMGVGGLQYTDRFHGSIKSDEAGRWKMKVKPAGFYLFVVKDEEFAAKAHDGVFIYETDEDLELDFELEPARRVFGKVTGSFDDSTYIMLQQKTRSYYDLPEELRLPNPTESNRSISAFTQESKAVAKDGSFEFKVGPGRFVIFAPDRDATEKFLIDDEQEKEFNFTLERPVRGKVSIKVVNAENDNQPLAGATVFGMGTEKLEGFLRGETGSDGVYAKTRRLVEMKVIAFSPDKSLVGVTIIGADDQEVEMEVSRSSKAAGRLVDNEGKPESGVELEIGIVMETEQGLSTKLSNESVTTDAEGRFEVDGLCQGETHTISRVMEKDSFGKPNSWRPFETFDVEGFEVDLGDVNSSKKL